MNDAGRPVARRRWALLAGLALAGTAAAAPDGLTDGRRDAAVAQRQAAGLEARQRRADRAAAAALDQATATVRRIGAAERDLAAARTRLAAIDRLRRAQRARIDAARAPLIGMTAAMQQLARRPAALSLVAPASIADLVHLRIALDATVPIVAARAAALRRELAAGERLRRAGEASLAARAAAERQLMGERAALLRLAGVYRGRAAALSDAALRQSDRALTLSAEADQLAAERQEDAARALRARRLAALPMPSFRPGTVARGGSGSGWRLPVAGEVLAGFGELGGAGVRSRGLVVAPRTAAPVIAPAAGRIAWAGPFGRYRGIVIVDHPGGWTTLVAGLGRTDTATGRTVRRGTPIGRAGGPVTIEARRHGIPQDAAALAAGD